MSRNNIELQWSSYPDFSEFSTSKPALGVVDTGYPNGDPGAYASVIDVDYEFEEIIKDKLLDGTALNFSKARYVVELTFPVFSDFRNIPRENIFNPSTGDIISGYRLLIDFLLKPYKRIHVYDYNICMSSLMQKFRTDKQNTINLITESFNKDNFMDNVYNKILSVKLISEKSFPNIFEEFTI
jgi:hypothetical protein